MATKREQIFAHPLRTESVTLPNGVVVEVRALGLTDRTALIKGAMVDGVMDATMLAIDTIIACVFDPDTQERVFSLGDRDELGKKGADILDPMFNAAAELNGMQVDAVEQAEKN